MEKPHTFLAVHFFFFFYFGRSSISHVACWTLSRTLRQQPVFRPFVSFPLNVRIHAQIKSMATVVRARETSVSLTREAMGGHVDISLHGIDTNIQHNIYGFSCWPLIPECVRALSRSARAAYKLFN